MTSLFSFLLISIEVNPWKMKPYTAISRRLSEKVHATIPKGIVGGFEFTVFQRSLKE